MQKPKIVILGGGFGGVYVARQLLSFAKKGLVEVVLISKTNYFLFTPLLHEVATGGLDPFSVTEPLADIFGDAIEVRVETVITIDRDRRIVTCGAEEINYDYLVIATGAESNDYGVPGVSQASLPLKTLADAVLIRKRIIENCDAFRLDSLVHQKPRFVVIGGGPTGVEFTAELMEFVEELDTPSEITLINAGPELLPQFDVSLRKRAQTILGNKGIKILLDRNVTALTEGKITFENGETVTADLIVWAAGVKAQVPLLVGSAPALRGGRMEVDEYLRLKDDERVFALGDVAAFCNPSDTVALPMLAQVAVRQAKTVVINLLASIRRQPLRTFAYRSKGALVSLGQWYAVGTIFSIRISGRFAWWLWRTVYLFKFFSWKKRFRIAFEWTMNMFAVRDRTNIT